ncbi:hypothetical protein [Nostoc linckia]|nr:hypothetical protein [Nostoc linckia]
MIFNFDGITYTMKIFVRKMSLSTPKSGFQSYTFVDYITSQSKITDFFIFRQKMLILDDLYLSKDVILLSNFSEM